MKNICHQKLYVPLHSAGRWFDDEVTDLPSTNKLVTKVIQEVVSSEVSMLNHAVMNKKQGDQMQFPLEEEDWKNEYEFIQPIILVYGL